MNQLQHKNIFVLTVGVIIFLTMLVFAGGQYLHDQLDKIQQNKYDLISANMRNRVSSLISDKHSSTTAITVTLSKNKEVVNAFSSIAKYEDFEKIPKILAHSTDYKNVWIQLIDIHGRSIFRSWTKDKDDDLTKIRTDVQKVIEKKEIVKSISVGKYTISFKSMVPVYDGDKFIGIIEIITHFNSISKKLDSSLIDNLPIAEKKFRHQIIHPFTGLFIDDYYVGILEPKANVIKFVKQYKIDKLKQIIDYKVIDNYIVTNYPIKNDNDEIIGHYLLLKDIKNIDNTDIDSFQTFITIFIFILFLFVMAIVFLLLIYKNSKQTQNDMAILKEEKEFTRAVLDAQANMVVLSNGKTLIDANKAVLDYITKYQTVEEFLKSELCICDYFEFSNEPNYISHKMYGDITWAQYIIKHPEIEFKAILKYDETLYHFIIKVNTIIKNDKTLYIVTMYDITKSINTNTKLANTIEQLKVYEETLEQKVEEKTKELHDLNENLEQRILIELEKNKKQDMLLQQQTRLAALGEMIGNIAHQWRQPLSAISTLASGIKVQQDFGLLTPTTISDSVESIIRKTIFLSQTIDDFRDFFKKDKPKESFQVANVIKNTFDIVKSNYDEFLIETTFELDDISIDGFAGELSQVILNLLNNAKDALVSNDIETKYVKITLHQDNSNVIISITDNAGGIPKDIFNKIFDPYFTTKHQSQGTGLGLYMSTQIIKNHFSGQLFAQNSTQKWDDTEFNCATFYILIPLQ